MALSLQAQRALAQTRDLFADTHWFKGGWTTDKGGKQFYCAVGGLRQIAVGAAIPDDDVVLIDSETYRTAVIALAAEIDPDTAAELEQDLSEAIADEDMSTADTIMDAIEAIVTEWNDDSGTDVESVLDVIDSALSKA